MFCANLVIPTQICDELSCGQGKVYGQTDRQTDRHRQWQYLFGLKGQGVKIYLYFLLFPNTGMLQVLEIFSHERQRNSPYHIFLCFFFSFSLMKEVMHSSPTITSYIKYMNWNIKKKVKVHNVCFSFCSLMNEVVHTSPTIGSNVEEVVWKNIHFLMWDIGGQESLRSAWSTYYSNAEVSNSRGWWDLH